MPAEQNSDTANRAKRIGMLKLRRNKDVLIDRYRGGVEHHHVDVSLYGSGIKEQMIMTRPSVIQRSSNLLGNRVRSIVYV